MTEAEAIKAIETLAEQDWEITTNLDKLPDPHDALNYWFKYSPSAREAITELGTLKAARIYMSWWLGKLLIK